MCDQPISESCRFGPPPASALRPTTHSPRPSYLIHHPPLTSHDDRFYNMRDPTAEMEDNTHQGATNGSSEPRRSNKSVRVAFGPGLDATIPARERSPTPLSSHHRSFTTVEQKQPSLAPPVRPTSSAGENAAAGVDTPPPRRPSPRRAETSRPAMLKRARSDYGPSRAVFDKSADEEEDFAMRHGWQEEYTSSEYLKILHSVRMRKSVECGRLLSELISIPSEFLHVFHGETPRNQRHP